MKGGGEITKKVKVARRSLREVERKNGF